MKNISKIIHEFELWKRSTRTIDDYAGVVNQIILSQGDVNTLKGVVIDDDYCIMNNINDDEFINIMENIIGVDYYVGGY